MTETSFSLVSSPATPVTETTLPEGTYAVAEQLGHATLVGRVQQVEKFGAQFLAIEPLFKDWMLPPVLLGGASLYRITPCTPATAWGMRAKYRHELPPSVCALVPEDPDPGFFEPNTAPAFLGFNEVVDDGDCGIFGDATVPAHNTPRYIVVEKAGYNGERDVAAFTSRTKAETWIDQKYSAVELDLTHDECLHVDIACELDGERTYDPCGFGFDRREDTK